MYSEKILNGSGECTQPTKIHSVLLNVIVKFFILRRHNVGTADSALSDPRKTLWKVYQSVIQRYNVHVLFEFISIAIVQAI